MHLLEIDLLRRGLRWPLESELPPLPYFVFLSRAALRATVEIWPIGVAEPLPRISVPLRAPDSDASLDLGAALARVAELGAYDLRIDYQREPLPPALPTTDLRWLDEQLRAAGLR